jgi:hypothetical protein
MGFAMFFPLVGSPNLNSDFDSQVGGGKRDITYIPTISNVPVSRRFHITALRLAIELTRNQRLRIAPSAGESCFAALRWSAFSVLAGAAERQDVRSRV